MRQPLKVAEHDRRAIPLGQPLDFLVQRLDRVAIRSRGLDPFRVAQSYCPGHRRLRLMAPPSRVLVLQPTRRVVSNPVEPGTQKFGLPQRNGLAGKYQERRLKGVLGIVRVAEQSPTGGQDHRSMPRHQGVEGRFGLLGSAGREPIQQLTVGQSRDRPPFEDRLELTLDRRTHDPHAPVLVNRVSLFLLSPWSKRRSLHFSVKSFPGGFWRSTGSGRRLDRECAVAMATGLLDVMPPAVLHPLASRLVHRAKDAAGDADDQRAGGDLHVLQQQRPGADDRAAARRGRH